MLWREFRKMWAWPWWPWSNISPNSSVFQCAIREVNLERYERGIGLTFRLTVVYFSMHFVAQI